MRRPLSVVTRDQDALVALIGIHAQRPPCPGCQINAERASFGAVCTCCDMQPRILDVTCNRRRIWKGLPYAVHGMDLDPSVEPDTVGDLTAWRTWPPGPWDVVVFDPPHMSEVGASSRMRAKFSTFGTLNVHDLFAPFMAAAEIAAPGALVLVKLANQMHRGQQQWAADAFAAHAAARGGWVKVDEAVRTRKAAGNDPRWTSVRCLRKVHSYWFAYRVPARVEVAA